MFQIITLWPQRGYLGNPLILNSVKKIKCNNSYVQFGFTCTETTEGLQKLQCMFPKVVFLTACLKPSILREHFKIRRGRADVSGQVFESLKAKKIRFK